MTALYPNNPSNPSADIDVLTIGHAIVDVLAAATDEFLAEEGLIKGAMHLIDFERANTLYGRMGPASENSGGCAANTAAGVATSGRQAAFIGTVANDQLGEVFTHDIRAAGVQFNPLPLQDSGGTGRSMILITSDSERTMNTYLGAAAKVAFEHVDPRWVQSSLITYFEGYLFDNGHLAKSWKKVIDIAHEAGRKTSMTLSDPYCVERNRSDFLGLLDGSIDICFGNKDEVCALFEIDDLEMAVSMLAERCQIAAVTLGPDGSIVASGSERARIKADPVNVVDTTGAGDLYAAGVLSGLSQGWDLERSGRLGSHLAGAIISRMGARLVGELAPLAD